MRLIHTSDWHLGRAFHGIGLLSAQAAFADHLVEVVRAERVRAVLVSGDVYDRALPAPDTVALLSETVTRLVDAGAAVVLSSGNHDSAIRLGFASGLLARAGLHIRSSVADVARPVLVDGVAIYAIPYLEPAAVASELGVAERTHASVLAAAADRISGDRIAADAARRGGRVVVMAHAFVTGGRTCDSERDIAVGGVAQVGASVFAGADYVALGHLHVRQTVTPRVRYSGSPLALSFSEVGQVKGSWLVDLDGESVRVAGVDAPVPRPLAVLRGDLEDVLADPRLAEAERAWCHVVLTDPIRPTGAMERVQRRFPHALKLDFEPRGTALAAARYASRRLDRRPALDVCCDFLAHVRRGAAADETERAVLAEALDGARLARAGQQDELGAQTGTRQGAA